MVIGAFKTLTYIPFGLIILSWVPDGAGSCGPGYKGCGSDANIILPERVNDNKNLPWLVWGLHGGMFFEVGFSHN